MSISALLDKYGSLYLQAMLTTWRLTVISFVGAMAIGLIITVIRVCPIKPLRYLGDFYVQIFRNIPGAAMLILLVYALPYLKLNFPYETCVLIATIMIPSAFCSEHLMSGMNTIAPGQIEAARALGFSFFQMIRRIVIPQALRSAVLPLTNLLVATMLTTSLASQVPMRPRDLTGIVSYINTRDVGGVLAFAISAALYCLTALLLGQLGGWIDRKVRILR
ncbi:MAG: ABC transporter permease subunit [Clostridia bacterium]|nr:ABC transporter permease subunit [Clostridia bacterium]